MRERLHSPWKGKKKRVTDVTEQSPSVLLEALVFPPGWTCVLSPAWQKWISLLGMCDSPAHTHSSTAEAAANWQSVSPVSEVAQPRLATATPSRHFFLPSLNSSSCVFMTLWITQKPNIVIEKLVMEITKTWKNLLKCKGFSFQS